MNYARDQVASFLSVDPKMTMGMGPPGYGGYADPAEITLRALESMFTRREIYDSTDGCVFIRQFVATILANRDVDLVTLSVDSTAGRIALEQICQLIGPHTSSFRAMCADRQTFFEFFTALCEHVKGIDVDFQRAQNSVALELITQYTVYFFPEDEKTLSSHPAISAAYIAPSLTSRRDNPFGGESFFEETQKYDHDVVLQVSAYANYFQAMVGSLTSMRRWPTILQIVILRFVIKQFYTFLLIPVSSTFDQRNKIRVLDDPPMVDEVQEFCESLFERWPLDATFRSVLDVWVAFTRPWRYAPAYGSPQGIEIGDYANFIGQSRGALLFPCQSMIKRFETADLYKLHTAASITLFAELLMKPFMKEVFGMSDVNVENVIDVLRRIAGSGIAAIKRREAFLDTKTKMMGWKRFIIDDTLLEREDLTKVLGFYYKLIPSEEPFALPSDFDDSQMIASEDEQGAEPDHRVDPSTGIKTLTRLGRKQVLRSRRHFNFGKAIKSVPHILAPPAWYENPTAVHLTFRLCEFLRTLSVTQKIASAYGQWTLLGLLAFLVMEPPFPRGGVPAFACNVEKRDASPNIRFIASYPFLVLCVFLILRFLFL